MKCLKKNMAYMRHIIRMTFSNIPRLFLSVSGLIVGLFILTVGSMVIDTYYNGLVARAEAYDSSSIILHLKGDSETVSDVIKQVGIDSIWENAVNREKETISTELYSNGYHLVLNATVIGTTPFVSDIVLLDYDSDQMIPVNAKLMIGRWINGQDLTNTRRVTIIDSFTAELLFGTTDCLGRTIQLGVQSENETRVSESSSNTVNKLELEVIGVFNSQEVETDNRFQYRKFQYRGQSNLILSTGIYIPLTLYRNLYQDESETEEYLTWKSVDTESLETKLDECETVFSSKCDEFAVLSKSDVSAGLEEEIAPVRGFMLIILLALFLISGINSMNIMFFSIKERMSEIGIKKAMGATAGDIILQFLMEGLLTSYLAAVIAVLLSLGASRLIQYYVENRLFIRFEIGFSESTCVLLFVVSTVYGLAFSFVPSFLGARSKVTDSLKFE